MHTIPSAQLLWPALLWGPPCVPASNKPRSACPAWKWLSVVAKITKPQPFHRNGIDQEMGNMPYWHCGKKSGTYVACHLLKCNMHLGYKFIKPTPNSSGMAWDSHYFFMFSFVFTCFCTTTQIKRNIIVLFKLIHLFWKMLPGCHCRSLP